MIQFPGNSHVTEGLTDWRGATDYPIYRIVFSQTEMLPAADAPRLVDRLSTSDSRAARQNRHPSVATGLGDDDQLRVRLLIIGWMLITDRALCVAVPPYLRIEEAPIAWADRQTIVGCVVGTGPTSRRGAR